MKKTKYNFYQRGSGEITGIVSLIVVGLVIWGALYLFGVSFGIENEGVVKYDDCRQVIAIKDDSWKKYLMKFTCNYIKSLDGKILGGECVHIVNDKSFLGSSHTCSAAYVYQRSPDVKCPDIVNGFLDISGGCRCKQNYKFNISSNKCEIDLEKLAEDNGAVLLQQSSSTITSTLPTEVGQCLKTTISKIGTRLVDEATGLGLIGIGSSIEYANGGYQVSYDIIQGIENSSVGDEVDLCLVSIPTGCPPGDNRGKVYKATNLKTGESWEASDSEHSCGGA